MKKVYFHDRMTSGKKSKHFAQLLELNLAMVLMSTSGSLGRYITMPPPVTIWWRCLLAAVFLGLFCWWWKVQLKIHHKRDFSLIFLGALLLGGHWITYFFALQYSSVAIGMLSLFTYPAFTSFLEPIILKTRFRPSHIILGVLVMLGIYLLAPSMDLQNDYTKGIVFGLISSVMYALRNILLKNRTSVYPGSALMLYQLIIISIVLSPVLFLFESDGLTTQWSAVVALALVTTAIGHTLFVMSFKHFSVSTASIISSTQPIYGIILGMIFLNEVPGWNTVLGGALILTTVVIESVRAYK